MIDTRALKMTGLLCLTLFTLPLAVWWMLGSLAYATTAVIAMVAWIRLVPAMPGFIQGLIFCQGAMLLFSNVLLAARDLL